MATYVTGYLGTGATASFMYTSASSLLQLVANSSLSLGTGATASFQYTSANSLFQYISDNSLSLGTGATASFRHTSADSLLQYLSNSTLSLGTQYTASWMGTAERPNYFYTSNNTFANNTHTHGAAVNVTNINATSASSGLSLSVPQQTGISGIGASNTTYTSGTVIFSNQANVTIGTSVDGASQYVRLSVDAPGGGAATTVSYYEYPSGGLQEAAQTFSPSGSSHYVFPFIIDQPVSFSYIRIPASFSLVSTSLATSAVPWTTQCSQVNTMQYVIYSRGVGANSRSLQYVASSYAGWTYSIYAQGAVSTNRWTCSQKLTVPAEGGQSDLNTNYASTLSTVNFSTTGMTGYTGWRYLDLPMHTLLNPGNYWMALNRSSTTDGGKNQNLGVSMFALSQSNVAIGNLGAGTNSSLQMQKGLGSWSTNSLGRTTSSIALANISSVASHLRPYLQFIREA